MEIPYFPDDILIDFNNRNINPQNIKGIISVCDYLLIENTLQFIIENALPTNELYILNELHSIHFTLPNYMSTGFDFEDVSKYV